MRGEAAGDNDKGNSHRRWKHVGENMTRKEYKKVGFNPEQDAT